MSSSLRPVFFSTLGMANAGPIPISSGSQPETASATKRAMGWRPSLLARSPLMSITAAAPSDIWLELPAVTEPVVLKAGRSLPSTSVVVPGTRALIDGEGEGLSLAVAIGPPGLDGNDLILESARFVGRRGPLVADHRPAVLLVTADIVSCRDDFGCVSHTDVGIGVLEREFRCGGQACLPPIGTIDMDSVPPPIPHSISPTWMRLAMIATACRPDEQKRLTVQAGTLLGRPAMKAARRPTFIPCSASGNAHPSWMSSMISGAIPARANHVLQHDPTEGIGTDVDEAASAGLADGGSISRNNYCILHFRILPIPEIG